MALVRKRQRVLIWMGYRFFR